MSLSFLVIRAYLRRYRVEWSDKFKTNKAIPVSDTLIAEYDCPHKAYVKTQRLIKRDFNNGVVQDVWFQTCFKNTVEQLRLF